MPDYFKKIAIYLPYLLLNKEHRDPISNNEWEKLVRLMAHHGLTPFFVEFGGLRFHDPEQPYKDRIIRMAKNITGQNLMKLSVQLEIGDILDKEQIPFLFIKGLNLSQIIYKNPTIRPVFDIDMLVSSRFEQDIRKILVAQGAREKGRLQSEFVQHLIAHDTPLLFREVVVEIHTHIVPWKYRKAFEDINLWKQISEYDSGDKKIIAFSPVFYLFYLCYHAHRHLLSGQIKLLWYIDIACFIASNDFSESDFKKLKYFAQKTDTLEDVEASLYIIQKHLQLYKDVFVTLNPSGSQIMFETRCLDLIQNPGQRGSFRYYMNIWSKLSLKEKVKYGLSIFFPSPAYIRSKFEVRRWWLVMLIMLLNPLRVIFKGLVFVVKKKRGG